MAETFPDVYAAEMRGLAKAAEMDEGEIIMFNIFYEIFSACTSVIAKGEKES